MRWNDIWIAGTGACLPDRVTVERAIRDGHYAQEDADRTQYAGIAVADEGQSAPDLAVAAARTALRRSGSRPEDIGALLHAVVLHSGLDIWNAAAYIQQKVLTPQCLPTELRGGCNGLVALEWACSHLNSHRDQSAVMVTTADRFQPAAVIDRWRADSAVVFADGGTSLVLSRDKGFARILSLTTNALPQLELMHRGDTPMAPAALSDAYPVDLAGRIRSFFGGGPMSVDEFWHRQETLVRTTVEQATAEADVDMRKVDHLVLPFIGIDVIQRLFIDAFGLDAARTVWDFARQTGHLGAGDPFAGLNHLVESGRLAPGNRVLLVSQGVGIIMTAMVLEVTEDPADRL
ncbi:ketoacyl-ACP synthase III family protein [Streptomyces capitiformicae]|uniref:3-oxoacyl-ACP synthase n=1 Tax=Streptomyces capitiformicae TaxID=2014920 RepID=A0A918YYE0_9ACTN|nr:ketoacyl-ACP synthase III family protein [Streptomyces capitiformicae]GHE29330.1 hypothetical protein GCM10017771_44990 [Streptomyces capitiformicae]